MDNKLRELIRREDEYLAGATYPELGWKYYSMDLTPQEIRKLVNAGYVSIVSKSNKHTWYKLNRDAIEQQLNASRELNNLYPQEQSIPDDLFSTIYGYDDIKRNMNNFIRRGKRGGFLLFGPPASAKTLFLLEMSRLPGSSYITASSATKVGLRDILLDDEPDYLCIDELDKATNKDYDLLLSLMETGIVQKNVHSVNVQKILNTQVFAAANREERVPDEIKSRFITLRIREYTPHEMTQVGEWMLVRREGVPEQTAKAIVGMAVSELNITDVREFMKIARLRDGDDMDSVMNTIEFLKKYS